MVRRRCIALTLQGLWTLFLISYLKRTQTSEVGSVPVLRRVGGEAHIELGPPEGAILHYRTIMDKVQKPSSPKVKPFTHIETVVQDETTHGT
jgi:hypothetical protein